MESKYNVETLKKRIEHMKKSNNLLSRKLAEVMEKRISKNNKEI